jgi:hypothetical protein
MKRISFAAAALLMLGSAIGAFANPLTLLPGKEPAPVSRPGHVLPVQYGPYGFCYAPGALKCVNGWAAQCRCFTGFCQWMATAYRC